MTAPVTRRSLLGAAPTLVAPMALLPASVAWASAETPIQCLFREYVSLESSINDGNLPEAQTAALFDELMLVEAQIAAEPATDMVDLAAKMLTLSCLSGKGDSPWDAGLRAECEALTGGSVAR